MMREITVVRAQAYVPELLYYAILDEACRWNRQIDQCVRDMQIVIYEMTDTAEIRVRHGADEWRTRVQHDDWALCDRRANIAQRILRWHDEDIHKFDYAGN